VFFEYDLRLLYWRLRATSQGRRNGLDPSVVDPVKIPLKDEHFLMKPTIDRLAHGYSSSVYSMRKGIPFQTISAIIGNQTLSQTNADSTKCWSVTGGTAKSAGLVMQLTFKD
jgi:hypothetical protein